MLALYKQNSLTEDDLIYRNAIVPLDAVIQAVSILEDSSYESNEKNYLIRNIYEEIRFQEWKYEEEDED